MQRSQLVRNSAYWIQKQSSYVHLDLPLLQQKVRDLISQKQYNYQEFEEFDTHLNPSQIGDETFIDYLFILDTLNFCFWPEKDYEYDQLSNSLKQCVLKDNSYFTPQNIKKINFEQFKERIFNNLNFPLIEERFRLFQDAADVVLENFEGKFINVILKSQHSSQKLLKLLTTHFLGFQDHSIYKGCQVYFYKRAQILIADLYAAYKGKGIGQFTDIAELTTFPDYRVPQILNEYGILKYSPELEKKIKNNIELIHGSEEECEIRAYTVIAVEEMKNEFRQQSIEMMSIEIDWLLWQIGETNRKNIIPHHRTLSIYY